MKKKDNRRFFKNALISLISLIIVAFIINITPGYKRDKYSNLTNLIISDENVTENLKNLIYLDNENNIYISFEDIKYFFDNTLCYDAETDTVIMSSNTKLANMKLNKYSISINNIDFTTKAPAIKIQNIIYLPMQELKNVYNLEINCINNKVIIDNLSKSMITSTVREDVELRYKGRTLSKVVTELSRGDSVYCFYTSSRGWRLIRTQDGEIGYIKANKLLAETVLRQDMDEIEEAKKINISLADETKFILDDKKVVIRDIPKLTSSDLETKEYNVWINVTNELSESEMNDIFNSYDQRTLLIDNIVNYAMKSEVKAVNIDMSAINTNENFSRFILELSPRLRDIGVLVNVVKTDELQIDLLKYKINYIIEKQ